MLVPEYEEYTSVLFLFVFLFMFVFVFVFEFVFVFVSGFVLKLATHWCSHAVFHSQCRGHGF